MSMVNSTVVINPSPNASYIFCISQCGITMSLYGPLWQHLMPLWYTAYHIVASYDATIHCGGSICLWIY